MRPRPATNASSYYYCIILLLHAHTATGEVVVGSDGAQWVREVGEVGGDEGGRGSVDECVMPTSTLVRAHEGDVAEGTCVWWRRRAGWC